MRVRTGALGPRPRTARARALALPRAHASIHPPPSHCHTRSSDGFVRQIVIPGSLRKKEWVGVGDILLVSLRIGMTDDKVGDLMAKLYPEEIQTLKQKGDISEAWQAGGAGEGEGEGGGFVFSDGVEEGDDDEEEEVNVRSAVCGVEDAGLLRGAPRPTARARAHCTRALSLLHTPTAPLFPSPPPACALQMEDL